MAPERPRATGWSLSARVTGLVIGVAVLVALLSGLISLRLLRSTVTDQARDQLSQRVDLLSRNSWSAVTEAETLEWMADSGDLYAVVGADGTVTGTAAGYVTPEMSAALLAGEDVSDSTRTWRAPVILEGRPADVGAIVLARPNTVIRTASLALVQRILPALGIGVVIAGAAGAWLARRITPSLVGTAHAATRLAAGERGVPVPASDIPEVRAVADALAALDTALATSEGRQHDFLLSISHEIRTPLTAMRGYAEALSDGVVGEADLPGVGRVLLEETDRLDRFVADLLELARLEADDFGLSPSRVDLRELLTAAEVAWRATANGVGVRIEVVQPAGPVVTTTDARRTRQVIDGLVENALRVSPEDGTLVLGLTASAGTATIAVRDAGPGLSDDDLARAFERGVLHARYRTTRKVGTGLGLSIAARLTERLGGTIAVARVPAGGSEFSVSLPIID